MTSHRCAEGGTAIDRTDTVGFTVDGRQYFGLAGDTLASALLANGVHLMGRSFKYHRPRGIVASGGEEPNGLVNMGRGETFEPNQRVTTATTSAPASTATRSLPSWGGRCRGAVSANPTMSHGRRSICARTRRSS